MLPEAYEDTEATLFPNLSEDEIWERVHKHWDIVNYSVPIPKVPVVCPVCWSTQIQIRSIPFHKTDSKTIPCRVDVNFKCTDCSMIWGHGVPVPEEMHEDLRQNAIGTRWIQQLTLMHQRGEITEEDISSDLHDRIHKVRAPKGMEDHPHGS